MAEHDGRAVGERSVSDQPGGVERFERGAQRQEREAVETSGDLAPHAALQRRGEAVLAEGDGQRDRLRRMVAALEGVAANARAALADGLPVGGGGLAEGGDRAQAGDGDAAGAHATGSALMRDSRKSTSSPRFAICGISASSTTTP